MGVGDDREQVGNEVVKLCPGKTGARRLAGADADWPIPLHVIGSHPLAPETGYQEAT